MSGVAAAIVGLVLLAAAAAKAHDGARYDDALASLASWSWVRRARPAIVALEAGLGALLLSGRAPSLTGAVAVATLLAFCAALVAFAARGGTDCGCFGAAAQASPRRGLIRNGALIAAALLVAVVGDGLAWDADAARAPAQLALAGAAIVLWRLGEAVFDLLADQARVETGAP